MCAFLRFHHVRFYVLIIMSTSVKRHELWCTVGDMQLSKCSIIIDSAKGNTLFCGYFSSYPESNEGILGAWG